MQTGVGRTGRLRALGRAVPAHQFCEAAVRQAFQNGLLLSCGLSAIRFMPPLMGAVEEVDEALAVLDASPNEVKQGAAS